MSEDDYIVIEIDADLADVKRSRTESATRRAPIGGTLSTDEVLVARPRDVPLDRYVSIASVASHKEAADARRDPRKLVARSIPVTVIQPLSAEEAGVSVTGDSVAAARNAKTSWGIPAVLGERPRDLTGAGVKVAVLDTGIDANHPAFTEIQSSIAENRRNFTDGSDDDVDGHGTHCAGTIFGRDVDGVRIGVARGVTNILIGKVIGDDGVGSTKSILDALKWAHSEGANIISMSLGFDFPKMQKRLMEQGHPPELATSIALKAYRDNLRQFETLAELLMQETDEHPGTVLVTAAGNESRRHLNPDFVIDVSIPAAAALDMISVGAIMRSDLEGCRLNVAPFSNINPRVSAPGVEIVSAKKGGGLNALNGTSMACPHVAGVAALWWEWISGRNQGQVKAADVRAQLRATARDACFLPNVTLADRGAGIVLGPQA
ncbi:Subtilase family protein [Rhizobiales bacterium GAS191]|nr:Subtilase family protein [Rhizobiales bacterium GAS191]